MRGGTGERVAAGGASSRSYRQSCRRERAHGGAGEHTGRLAGAAVRVSVHGGQRAPIMGPPIETGGFLPTPKLQFLPPSVQEPTWFP
jgi:hypothetical protein